MHPLDRPVWNSLNSGWSALAQGNAHARRIDPDHGPFAAAMDDGAAAQQALADLVPETGEMWLVERRPIALPPGVRRLREARLAQMIADGPAPFPSPRPAMGDIESMGESDGGEMRALALMTKPGPFHPLTHRLGRFIGIRSEGRLVAMAGERMRMPGLAEISGVCTHPDHRGRGHAKRLMLLVMQGMRDRNETPFLHAYADHGGTIALYETLGFRVRATMEMMVVAR